MGPGGGIGTGRCGGRRVSGGWRLAGRDDDGCPDATGAGSDRVSDGSESPPQPVSTAARHPTITRRERTDMAIPP